MKFSSLWEVEIFSKFFLKYLFRDVVWLIKKLMALIFLRAVNWFQKSDVLWKVEIFPYILKNF